MFQYNNDYPKNYGNPESNNQRNSKFDEFDSISYDDNDNQRYGGNDAQEKFDAYDDPGPTGQFHSYSSSSFDDISTSNQRDYFSPSFDQPKSRQNAINTVQVSFDENIPDSRPMKDLDYEEYDWSKISDGSSDHAATGSVDLINRPSSNIASSSVNEAATPKNQRNDESYDWRKISNDNIINTVQSPDYNRNNNMYVPSFSRAESQNQPMSSTNVNKNTNNDWMKISNGNINKAPFQTNSIPNNHYSGYNNRNYDTQSHASKNRMSFEEGNSLEISYDTEDTQTDDYDIVNDDDYNDYDWKQISPDNLVADPMSRLGYQQFDSAPHNNIDSNKFVPSSQINQQKNSDNDEYDKSQTKEDYTVNDIKERSNPIISDKNGGVIYQRQSIRKDGQINPNFDYYDSIKTNKYDNIPPISNDENNFSPYENNKGSSYNAISNVDSYPSLTTAYPVGPIFHDQPYHPISNQMNFNQNKNKFPDSSNPNNENVLISQSNKARDTKRNTKYDEFDAIPMNDNMDDKTVNEMTRSNKKTPTYNKNNINNVPTATREVQRNIMKKTSQRLLPQKGSALQ